MGLPAALLLAALTLTTGAAAITYALTARPGHRKEHQQP